MIEVKDLEFAKEIEEVMKKSNAQPRRLNKRLGLQLVDCSREDGYAEYGFRVEEWCLNPSGGVHGGAICSLFDTGMGMGAVALSQMNVTTTDISVSFLKPMNGKQYIFHVEYTNAGRRMIRTMGKAFDGETGKLCATAMATFMIIGSRDKALQV